MGCGRCGNVNGEGSNVSALVASIETSNWGPLVPLPKFPLSCTIMRSTFAPSVMTSALPVPEPLMLNLPQGLVVAMPMLPIPIVTPLPRPVP